MHFLVVFVVREVVDEDGEIVEVHVSVGLPLEIEGVDDAGLALFVLLLLDVLLPHELADVAEALGVDLELLEVALDAQLVEVGVFVVGVGDHFLLREVHPHGLPEGVAQVEQVFNHCLVLVLVEVGGHLEDLLDDPLPQRIVALECSLDVLLEVVEVVEVFLVVVGVLRHLDDLIRHDADHGEGDHVLAGDDEPQQCQFLVYDDGVDDLVGDDRQQPEHDVAVQSRLQR